MGQFTDGSDGTRSQNVNHCQLMLCSGNGAILNNMTLVGYIDRCGL